jgi:cysteine desulfurase/selenocysteine lyase
MPQKIATTKRQKLRMTTERCDIVRKGYTKGGECTSRIQAVYCYSMPLATENIHKAFPILKQRIGDNPLVYLDNAATTQKPAVVIERMQEFYERENANINRGVHPLAEAATDAYEQARKTVASFIGAAHPQEVVFTRGTTESINLVARSFGSLLKKGEGIAITTMEHHSNIVPWQQLAERQGTTTTWIPVSDEGTIDQGKLKKIIVKENVKLVSVSGLSNVLGTPTPIAELVNIAHDAGAKILIDAAQLIGHRSIDVQKLDIDFLAFSGHKLYGPTGIGVLYAKEKILELMPPFLGGGDMITTVTEEGFTPAELPRKFEAGTPAIAEAIGLGAAIEWLQSVRTENTHTYTKELIAYAHRKLQAIDGIRILGAKNPDERLGCISFTLEGIHPHDLTDILGKQGFCLRAGHHCAQPLHRQLKIAASTRLSVAAYNTKAEIDACCDAIEQARKKLLG